MSKKGNGPHVASSCFLTFMARVVWSVERVRVHSIVYSSQRVVWTHLDSLDSKWRSQVLISRVGLHTCFLRMSFLAWLMSEARIGPLHDFQLLLLFHSSKRRQIKRDQFDGVALSRQNRLKIELNLTFQDERIVFERERARGNLIFQAVTVTEPDLFSTFSSVIYVRLRPLWETELQWHDGVEEGLRNI